MIRIIQNITKRAINNNFAKHDATGRLTRELADRSFVLLNGNSVYELLFEETTDLHAEWSRFQDSWNRLERDRYMADGGQYRLRRHAAYTITQSDNSIKPAVYIPHYQSLEHNSLNGGVARYFSPIEPATCSNRIMINVLMLCRDVFCPLNAEHDWQIEVHQFRIETCAGTASPTPEGVHRDGVNFVFMMMINRQHLSGGMTFLYDESGSLLHQHTLTDAMESVFIDDERIFHGVSPIIPATPDSHGYRDMLVITFRQA